jgi:hypothetical protein
MRTSTAKSSGRRTLLERRFLSSLLSFFSSFFSRTFVHLHALSFSPPRSSARRLSSPLQGPPFPLFYLVSPSAPPRHNAFSYVRPSQSPLSTTMPNPLNLQPPSFTLPVAFFPPCSTSPRLISLAQRFMGRTPASPVVDEEAKFDEKVEDIASYFPEDGLQVRFFWLYFPVPYRD